MVADRILATRNDRGARGATRKPARRQILGRIVAGVVMGALTLGLIGLTAAVGPTAALFQVQLILPVSMIATLLVVSLSSTARAAWGRLCFINGIMSIALAAASVERRGNRSGPWIPATRVPSIGRCNGGSDT